MTSRDAAARQDKRRVIGNYDSTSGGMETFSSSCKSAFINKLYKRTAQWMTVTVDNQRTLTYFGSITVQLTSCLTRLDSAALLILNWIQIYKFSRIQTRNKKYTTSLLYSWDVE